MAQPRSPFQRDTPVLWMDPRPPAHALGRRYLLWPAWSYLVLAPQVQPRREGPLNILDEAFLRLLEAGLREIDELAGTLCVDRALAAYIRTDLWHRELCDEHGEPTDAGRRALRDRAERLDELAQGQVFREPATGALWGRFVERPGYAEVEWRQHNPRLVLGPEGRARREEVLWVAPEHAEPPLPPRPEEVLREVEIHRRACAGGRTDVADIQPAPAQLSRISLVRDRPEPVWLAVPLYATRVEDDGAPWHACDPFGIGSSPPLRKSIERRATEHPELAALLRELVQEGAARRETRAQESARSALGERFGADLQKVRGLQGAMMDMRLALSNDKRRAGAPVARGRMRGVVECVLRATLPERADEASELTVDLVDDRDYDSRLMIRRAEDVGFGKLPHAMGGVTAASVRAAAEGRDSSPRPLFLANVLAAALDAGHPLRLLAGRWPAFPEWLDALAEDRWPAVEELTASDRREALTQLGEEALDFVEWMLMTDRAVGAGAPR